MGADFQQSDAINSQHGADKAKDMDNHFPFSEQLKGEGMLTEEEITDCKSTNLLDRGYLHYGYVLLLL